jgi:hypothetical protein
MRLLVLILVSLAIVTAACDGDTFAIDLVNDTGQAQIVVECKFDDCENPRSSKLLAPDESARTIGVVGVVSWWQVLDLDENVLGCFRLDFDERPKHDLFASDLGDCP